VKCSLRISALPLRPFTSRIISVRAWQERPLSCQSHAHSIAPTTYSSFKFFQCSLCLALLCSLVTNFEWAPHTFVCQTKITLKICIRACYDAGISCHGPTGNSPGWWDHGQLLFAGADRTVDRRALSDLVKLKNNTVCRPLIVFQLVVDVLSFCREEIKSIPFSCNFKTWVCVCNSESGLQIQTVTLTVQHRSILFYRCEWQTGWIFMKYVKFQTRSLSSNEKFQTQAYTWYTWPSINVHTWDTLSWSRMYRLIAFQRYVASSVFQILLRKLLLP